MADADLDRDDKDDETGAAAEPAREPRGRTRIMPRPRPFAELDKPVERGAAAFVAEFIGTFALVFFVCTVVVLYAPPPTPPAQPGLPPTQEFQDWAVIGLVHVFVLFFLIQ